MKSAHRIVTSVLGLLLVGCQDATESPVPAYVPSAQSSTARWDQSRTENPRSRRNRPVPPIVPAPAVGIEVSPAALDFGDVMLGSDRVLSVTVKNVGTDQLWVSAIGLTTSTSPEFVLLAGPESVSLAPEANIEIKVLFEPTRVSASTGTLVIQSEDPDEPEVQVPVDGCGVLGPTPELDVAPASLSFPDVLVGSSESLEVTLRNTGSAPLHVSSLELDDATSLEFALGPDARAGEVAPGAQIAFHVVYAPLGEGSDSGTLRVESDDFDESTVQLSLTGNAIAAPAPEIAVSPLSLEFGEVYVGSSASRSFTVSNTGSAALSILSAELGPGTTNEFSITAGPASTSVTPEARVTWTVRYSPTDLNSDSRTVRVVSDDADENVVVVSLSGTGVSAPVPEIEVSTLAIDFGDVLLGSSIVRWVSVHNSGTRALQVSTVSLVAGTSLEFAVVRGGAGGTVEPGSSLLIDIRYTPTAAWDSSGALRIDNDDADEGIVFVSLAGVGVPVPAPEVDVAPTDLDFGSVTLGESSTRSFGVTNTGSAVLQVSSIRIGSGSSGDFSVVAGAGSHTIAAGASVSVTVRYSPTSANSVTGVADVVSNDADELVVSVSLIGEGLEVPFGDVPTPVTLAWDAPTTNSDGTLLDDLAGFRVYRGAVSHDYTEVHDVGNVQTFTTEALPPGTYYFAVTAYDFSGNESAFSVELDVVRP